MKRWYQLTRLNLINLTTKTVCNSENLAPTYQTTLYHVEDTGSVCSALFIPYQNTCCHSSGYESGFESLVTYFLQLGAGTNFLWLFPVTAISVNNDNFLRFLKERILRLFVKGL